MQNIPVEIKKAKWHQSPEAGGIFSLISGIWSLISPLIFHNPTSSAGWSGLGFIVGLFGLIKGNKMGKILSIIGVIISVFSFLLFNPFQSKFKITNGSIYENPEYNFQIVPPIGWTINENPKSGGIVAFVDLSAPASDYPVISVNLLPGSVSLDDYVNNGIIESQNLPQFSLINKEKFGSGKDSYYIIESKLDINKLSGGKIGNAGSSAHMFMLTKQAKEGKFFIITGESDNIAWDKYASLIKDSILSFKNLD